MTTPSDFNSFYNRESIKNPANVRVGDIGLGIETSPEKDFGKFNSGAKEVRKSNINYSRVGTGKRDYEDN